MITAGIIAEYNPFHRGHRYHIEETRKRTGAEYIVVVMSGDFVQRGEPAIVDKYCRAEAALTNGADLVLELPVYYATASAEFFATAGVTLLHNLQCVEYLSFGSEWAQVDNLESLAELLLREPEEYRQLLREELRKGCNFPAARENALRCLMGKEQAETAKLLQQPNHILALEYVKAIRRLPSSIRPVAIPRKGSGYHEISMDGLFPSASAIRRELSAHGSGRKPYSREQKNRLVDAMGETASLFMEQYLSGDTVGWEELMPYVDYRCIMEGERLPEIFGMEEAMAARLLRDYRAGASVEQLLQKCHGRNWTDTALRRAFLHLVLGLDKKPFLRTAANLPVPYARVLGFRKRAVPLLKEIREKGKIPLIQRPVEGKKLFQEKEEARCLFSADIRAAELYEQLAAKKCGRLPVSEWKRQQIIKEKV